MLLSLIELKEKLKPQLESLLGANEFKIVIASHSSNSRSLEIEYQKPYKTPSGDMTYFKTDSKFIIVDDGTG